MHLLHNNIYSNYISIQHCDSKTYACERIFESFHFHFQVKTRDMGGYAYTSDFTMAVIDSLH